MRTSDFRISTRIASGFVGLAAFWPVLRLVAMAQFGKVAEATERIATADRPRGPLSAGIARGNGDRSRGTVSLPLALTAA